MGHPLAIKRLDGDGPGLLVGGPLPLKPCGGRAVWERGPGAMGRRGFENAARTVRGQVPTPGYLPP